MRLTIAQEMLAAEELLKLITNSPDGLRTKELRGTKYFHGSRTLSSAQIIRLLRKTGQIKEQAKGWGIRTYTIWKFNKTVPPNAKDLISRQLLDLLSCKTINPEVYEAICNRARRWGFDIPRQLSLPKSA